MFTIKANTGRAHLAAKHTITQEWNAKECTNCRANHRNCNDAELVIYLWGTRIAKESQEALNFLMKLRQST